MQLINSTHTVLPPAGMNKVPPDMDVYQFLETIGRRSYQSQDAITTNSCIPFIKKILKKRHYSILEHYYITVDSVVSRDMAVEMVRHRIASYNQESTRYVKYNELQFIYPEWFSDPEKMGFQPLYTCSLEIAERNYLFTKNNTTLSPQEIKGLLPGCLATNIIATMNIAAWRNFLSKRNDPAALPEIRKYAQEVQGSLMQWLPLLFSDIIPYSCQKIINTQENS